MKNDLMSTLSKKIENRSEAAVSNLTHMFGITDDLKVTEIPLVKLREKKNHPFKVITDDKLSALADSIKENGLMEPIIVRECENNSYEILAGHRRTRAVGLNGELEIKAIVVDVDDETANRIMLSTNFQHRDSYLPSEIAKSYLIRYTDLKNSRKMVKENSDGWNSDNKLDRIMEKEFNTSKSNIYMYLRFNHLIGELLEVVDEKKMGLKIAAEVSYLREVEQKAIYDIVCAKRLYKLDWKKAINIKKASAERELEETDIIELLADVPNEGKTTIESETISISKAELKIYQGKFKSFDDMKRAIFNFLENY